MKQDIVQIVSIVLLSIVPLFGCEDDDRGDEIATTAGRVYFEVQNILVDRTLSGPLTVQLRYEGTSSGDDKAVEYTVGFPGQNNAIEGEDFVLPKSGSFVVKRGRASSQVTLLQSILDNQNADEERSLSFELQPKEGITVGDTSNSRGVVTVTIGTSEDAVDPIDPTDFIGDKKFSLGVGTSTLEIPYFSNREDIRDTDNPDITRAVVVLHGANRVAGSSYQSMLGAAMMETDNLDSLLIVSPQFLTEEDINEFMLDEEHLYWTSEWRLGFDSLDGDGNPRPEQVSSFTVMDSIMVKLSEYPNLKKIVLSGHSAGGQFVNRYSASSPIADNLSARGVELSFIVNNPSSYVYMDGARKVRGTENTFTIPSSSEILACPEYNAYRYGLEENLPPYLIALGGEDVIRMRLPQREVTYLIGQNDNDPNGNLVDSSCEVLFQGADRFERAINYFDYLVHFYGPSIREDQRIKIVPGVGHSSRGMFQSESGRKYAFRN
ncbi:MAG: hypothetical protein AAF717_21630 [Bacteroidota bacterium]